VNGQEEIQVAINVSHLTEPIVGGQFFLEYTGHGTCWVFAGGTSVPPFDVEINQNQPAPGKIDYAVSVLPGTPASQADGTMAILHMMPMPDASGCCRVSIGFREHDPATLLTTSGGGQGTPLQLVPAIGSKVDITIDMEAPTITCPPNQYVPAAAGR